jgi:hypothetical protein
MDCLILARGGSKGVPKKNIKLLDGIPLIGYVISEAKKSKKIDQIFVSTDCDEIIKVVEEYGVNVIKRPPELSQDNSLDIDSFIHFCNLTNNLNPIVHLRATTPLIDYKIIDNAIELFELNHNVYTSLRSAHEMSESAYKFFVKKGNTWSPIIDGIDQNNPRQSYEKTYIPNGYVDIVNPNIFLKRETFYGDKIYSFITERTYEVDTIEDFNYIEYILKK